MDLRMRGKSHLKAIKEQGSGGNVKRMVFNRINLKSELNECASRHFRIPAQSKSNVQPKEPSGTDKALLHSILQSWTRHSLNLEDESSFKIPSEFSKNNLHELYKKEFEIDSPSNRSVFAYNVIPVPDNKLDVISSGNEIKPAKTDFNMTNINPTDSKFGLHEPSVNPSGSKFGIHEPSVNPIGSKFGLHEPSVNPIGSKFGIHEPSVNPIGSKFGLHEPSVNQMGSKFGLHEPSVNPIGSKFGLHEPSVNPIGSKFGLHEPSVNPSKRESKFVPRESKSELKMIHPPPLEKSGSTMNFKAALAKKLEQEPPPPRRRTEYVLRPRRDKYKLSLESYDSTCGPLKPSRNFNLKDYIKRVAQNSYKVTDIISSGSSLASLRALMYATEDKYNPYRQSGAPAKPFENPSIISLEDTDGLMKYSLDDPYYDSGQFLQRGSTLQGVHLTDSKIKELRKEIAKTEFIEFSERESQDDTAELATQPKLAPQVIDEEIGGEDDEHKEMDPEGMKVMRAFKKAMALKVQKKTKPEVMVGEKHPVFKFTRQTKQRLRARPAAYLVPKRPIMSKYHKKMFDHRLNQIYDENVLEKYSKRFDSKKDYTHLDMSLVYQHRVFDPLANIKEFRCFKYPKALLESLKPKQLSKEDYDQAQTLARILRHPHYKEDGKSKYTDVDYFARFGKHLKMKTREELLAYKRRLIDSDVDDREDSEEPIRNPPIWVTKYIEEVIPKPESDYTLGNPRACTSSVLDRLCDTRSLEGDLSKTMTDSNILVTIKEISSLINDDSSNLITKLQLLEEEKQRSLEKRLNRELLMADSEISNEPEEGESEEKSDADFEKLLIDIKLKHATLLIDYDQLAALEEQVIDNDGYLLEECYAETELVSEPLEVSELSELLPDTSFEERDVPLAELVGEEEERDIETSGEELTQQTNEKDDELILQIKSKPQLPHLQVRKEKTAEPPYGITHPPEVHLSSLSYTDYLSAYRQWDAIPVLPIYFYSNKLLKSIRAQPFKDNVDITPMKTPGDPLAHVEECIQRHTVKQPVQMGDHDFKQLGYPRTDPTTEVLLRETQPWGISMQPNKKLYFGGYRRPKPEDHTVWLAPDSYEIKELSCNVLTSRLQKFGTGPRFALPEKSPKLNPDRYGHPKAFRDKYPSWKTGFMGHSIPMTRKENTNPPPTLYRVEKMNTLQQNVNKWVGLRGPYYSKVQRTLNTIIGRIRHANPVWHTTPFFTEPVNRDLLGRRRNFGAWQPHFKEERPKKVFRPHIPFSTYVKVSLPKQNMYPFNLSESHLWEAKKGLVHPAPNNYCPVYINKRIPIKSPFKNKCTRGDIPYIVRNFQTNKYPYKPLPELINVKEICVKTKPKKKPKEQSSE